ncbi:Chaperone-modulator protein [Escherichia coli]|nr:Chaperone-modulator protein [Escherichia coli]
MKLSVWGWLNRVRSQETTWVFDDHAAIVVQRAVRLRHELALDWPGIAVALTLMDDIAHLKQENRLLRQRLSRFVAHP